MAGVNNLTFTAADLLNPKELKLIGFAVNMAQAWNIYDEKGRLRDNLEEMPIMPMDAVTGYNPDCVIIAADHAEGELAVKRVLIQTDFRGEVISLFQMFKGFSSKTAAIRKMAWRLAALGVKGATADLGAYYGDISWQLNALMPDRKLYLFDTFTGYDARDVQKEKEKNLSDARVGEYALSSRQQETLTELLLGKMPYPEKVKIMQGWFPETAFGLEEETYALVHIDTGLYAPTFSGIQYFFSRMSPGGVIFVSQYENGKNLSVRQAVEELEDIYGAFLITPLCDLEGTIIITRP